MAIDVTEVAPPEAQPDGTRAEYGRVWYQGKKVSAKTYAAATGSLSTPAMDPVTTAAHEPATPPPAPSAPVVVSDSTLAQFADLAAVLGRADAKQREKNVAIESLDKLLTGLPFDVYADLAEHPMIQRINEALLAKREQDGDRRPGTVVGEGNQRQDIPWRMSDVIERAFNPNHPEHEAFQLVPVTFPRTEWLGWNGLGTWVFEGLPTNIPRCWYQLWLDSQVGLRAAREHRDYLFARALPDGNRAGPKTVPSDPTIMAGPGGITSRMLQGKFAGGTFNPGAGLTMDVPDGDRPGYEPGEEGDGADEAA